MTDSIIENYNQLRQKVVEDDRRFQQKDGHLCFEGVDLDALARKYPTPFYVFSEPEIIRNIKEIEQAFAAHKNTKNFFCIKNLFRHGGTESHSGCWNLRRSEFAV